MVANIENKNLRKIISQLKFTKLHHLKELEVIEE